MVSPMDIILRTVLEGHTACVSAVDLDEKYLVSASWDKTIKVCVGEGGEGEGGGERYKQGESGKEGGDEWGEVDGGRRETCIRLEHVHTDIAFSLRISCVLGW